MANSSQKSHCLFVETSLKTCLAVLIHEKETVSAFKENLCREHKLSFRQVGEITISALKVNHGGLAYHLPDSLVLSKVFEGTSENWFLNVDVMKVEEQEKKLEINNSDYVAISPDDICTGAKGKDFEKGEIILCDQVKDLAPVLQVEHGLTTGLEEKKRKRKKNDHIKQPTDASSKRSRKNVKVEEVFGSIDGVVATSQSVPNSGGEKLVEATKQETEMVSSSEVLILPSESKMDENRNLKDDVPKDNGEMEAVEAKSAMSSKKKKSKKAKILAQEDTLFASAGQNTKEDTKVSSAGAMEVTDN